jgi:hypothetical protein
MQLQTGIGGEIYLMIDHFEAIKHELIFLWLIWLVYSLQCSYKKILEDAAVDSEHDKNNQMRF